MSENKSRRALMFLVVSVILNALLLGFIIGGGLAQNRGDRGSGPRGAEMNFARLITQNAASEDRTAIRNGLRQAFMETREQRRLIREKRRELSELLLQDPYDPEAVASVFVDLRSAETAKAARLHQELTEQFGRLTLQQRQDIISAMSTRRSSRPPMGEDRTLPPGDPTRRSPNH